jgi:hypothetical protein
VITGFNTDIEHEGTVYHVQTEDKGLDTPLILSLVYVGGAILASKRSPYDDLIVSGFDAAALSERLNRQHKLICAAITAGRIEDLKRLSRDGAAPARKSSRKSAKAQPRAAEGDSAGPAAETKRAAGVPADSEQPEVSTVSAQSEVPTVAAQPDASPPFEAPARADAAVSSNGDAAAQSDEEFKSDLPSWFETTAESFASILEKVAASEAAQEEAARAEAAQAEAARVEAAKAEAAEAEQRRRFPPKDALVASNVARPADVLVEAAAPAAHAEAQVIDSALQAEVTETIPVEVEGELHVSLMEERDYKAGEIVTLRVRVSRGPLEAREAVNDATVTVKILGTEFRPLILTSKTDRDGVAVIHAWLPRFTSGRAAILVRAAHDGFSAELRRAVRHL